MRSLATLLAGFLLSMQAAALELKPGVALPLSSGAAPAFAFFDVQHAPSTGRIDVSVVFDAPPASADPRRWEYLDYGELCLRYGAELLAAAVQAEQLPLLRVMTVIYRRPEDVGSTHAFGRGFTFLVREGRCVIDGYPGDLTAEVQRRAALPL